MDYINFDVYSLLLDENYKIINLTNQYINESRIINNGIAKKNSIDRDNIINMLADDLTEYSILRSICDLRLYFFGDRIDTIESNKLLSDYLEEVNSRKDVYDKVKQVYNNLSTNKNKSCVETTLFLKRIIKGYERNGINLSKKQKQRMNIAEETIMNQEDDINKYINSVQKTVIEIPNEFLKGMSFVSLINGKEKQPVCLNKINYELLTRFLESGDARSYIEKQYFDQCTGIIKNVYDLIVKKQEYAGLINYECYSDYTNEKNLLKTSNTVQRFLSDVYKITEEKYMEELKYITKLNKNKKIKTSDIQYLIGSVKDQDAAIYKEYFQLGLTISNILNIYQSIFGIQFVKVNTKIKITNIDTYEVYKNKGKIGTVYIYLKNIIDDVDKVRVFPLNIPCTYPKATKGEIIGSAVFMINYINYSVLLGWPEVVNIFREFGNIIHHILNKSTYCIDAGITHNINYLEMPLYLLEYYAWNDETIKQLSCHHVTGKQMSNKMINKIIADRNIDIAIQIRKHLLVATYDQLIHSSKNFIEICVDQDLSTIFEGFYKQLSKQIFPGMIIDYDGMWLYNLNGDNGLYYNFMWNKIGAADIYYEIKKQDKLSEIGFIIHKLFFCNNKNKNVYNKVKFTGFIKLHDLEKGGEYVSENTESLARYSNLFLRQ